MVLVDDLQTLDVHPRRRTWADSYHYVPGRSGSRWAAKGLQGYTQWADVDVISIPAADYANELSTSIRAQAAGTKIFTPMVVARGNPADVDWIDFDPSQAMTPILVLPVHGVLLRTSHLLEGLTSNRGRLRSQCDAAPTEIIESILQRLGRLRDGWAGPSSIAPPPAVLAELSKVAIALQGVRVEPDIEVDPDGSVSLIWDRLDESFSLTFTGNGRVVGTMSPYRPGYGPWSAEVSDEVTLSDRLEDAMVVRFVNSDAVQ